MQRHKRGKKLAKPEFPGAPDTSLKRAKRLLNLANNHVWDYGEEGFRMLAKPYACRVAFVGGGKTRAHPANSEGGLKSAPR